MMSVEAPEVTPFKDVRTSVTDPILQTLSDCHTCASNPQGETT